MEALLLESTHRVHEPLPPAYRVGGEDIPPITVGPGGGSGRAAWASETPPTDNPAARDLRFTPAGIRDAETVIERLDAYSEPAEDAVHLDLAAALVYALGHSREYRFAEEEYILAALRLLIERHRWGPRFFNEMSAEVSGDGDQGLFDTSLRLVNEFRVTQRLPYGGEVSARALATAVEDLHQRVAGERVQDATIILAADIPLLRGAGLTAREDRIQAERDLVYAARGFGRFRREFLFDIARDFLDLIVSRQRIANARLSVESFQDLERQQEALYRGGRATPFDTAEAKNDTLDAVDRLNGVLEDHRLSLDRFKVTIGMQVAQPLVIERGDLGLPTPKVVMNDAVYAAMSYRLDLQTRRDGVDDARRGVEISRNELLGDLDVQASITIPTDDTRARAGLRFEPEDASFLAGITYGLPLDRDIERFQLRQTQIDLERSRRSYDRFRDEIASRVRGAVRGIDRATFSLEIQETNVRIAEQRQASIEADPDRADIRQKTDAITQVLRASDARDSARRDLEVAVLFYLLETGQLRVDVNGFIEPLIGMDLLGPEPVGEAGG